MTEVLELYVAIYSPVVHPDGEEETLISYEAYEQFHERYKKINRDCPSRRIAGKCPEVGFYFGGGLVLHNPASNKIRLVHDTKEGLEKLAEEFGLP
ncbi:hypothetical protein J4463_04605 [Candidatus Pacearchaeota archaeon]|nr:hypothetical protein [Candidatus Pacearchaeota archaeon]